MTPTFPIEPPQSHRAKVFGWILGALFLLMAWTGSVFTLRAADAGKSQDWNQSSLLYLPSGKLLKPMALDFDEALAGIIWVQGILYFSDQYLQNQQYAWMGHILDIVTTLNPRFLPAYEFGGTVLVKDGAQNDLPLKLLRQGIENFPGNWKLRVYAAMLLMKQDSNYAAAAEVLKPISLLPDVPDYIRTLSATFLKKGGGDKLALSFLVDSYLQSPDAINRDVFLERLLKLFPNKGNDVQKKENVRKILEMVKSDFRLQPIMLGVLYDYLRGDLTEGSKRVLDLLHLSTPY